MRLFVAAFPPAPSAEKLAAVIAGLRVSDARVRWVEPSTAHFTLAFIGETLEEDKIGAALRRACARVPAFRAAFGRPGAFDSWDRPKILWLGLEEGEGPMVQLAEAVRSELKAENLPFDPKPFKPHLTLGRAKGAPTRDIKERVEAAFARVDFPSFEIGAAELVESKSGASGPVYTRVRREALFGAA